jgi:FAD/FMN-containing dehydrogenase
VTSPQIADDLAAIVGHDHVLVDDDLRAGYERDWTGRYGGGCTAVVRPGSTAELAAVLRYCNSHHVAVIPQAGNTGLVGGGVPGGAGRIGRDVVVLSMRRLDRVSDVEPPAMALTAGAGVTIADWQEAARRVGLDTPIDFAARASATVGGAIATNAGGSRVVRFGTMRHQVLGVEAVLADGTVVGSLAGLPKETVGLHWPSVLTGSEGTLAVITAARLRLVASYAHVSTAMVSLDGVASAVELLAALRSRLDSLDSIEMVFPEAVQLVSEHLARPVPIEVGAGCVVVLVECADHHDPEPALLAVLGAADGVIDTAIATDGRRRDDLLAFRDRITESIGAATTDGPPTYKLDVAVPVSSLDAVIEAARGAAQLQGARLIPFGHLAEGNLHLNFLDTTDTDTLADTVLALVAECGGTISAEHGIGVAKTRWMHLVRSADDLAAQRAIRRALDPNAILNPGVLEPGVIDPGVVEPGDADPVG